MATGGVPPLPPAGYQPTSMWEPPGPRPPAKRRGSVPTFVVVLVVLGFIGVVGAVILSQTPSDEPVHGATREPEKALVAPNPRVTRVGALNAYCGSPTAWPEVARHVPTQPGRSQIVLTPAEFTSPVATGFDNGAKGFPYAISGSTVLSPHTDGKLTGDATVLSRTRTVTCVTLDSSRSLDRSCNYTSVVNQTASTLQLAQDHYRVTVYELHSGHVLHKGEILTRSDGCPDHIQLKSGVSTVAYDLSAAEVMNWITTHFVDGKPR